MDAKYLQALKAGVIGGVILAACILLILIIEVITNRVPALGALGLGVCCVWIIMVIVLGGAGALAAFMAKTAIVKMEEALIVGAIAGAVTGLFGTIMQVIVAIITPWLVNTNYSDYYSSLSQYGGLGSNLGQSTLGVVGSICCCGPSYIIIGVILAAIGAAIYASVKLKLKLNL